MGGGDSPEQQNHISVSVEVSCLDVQESHQILYVERALLLQVYFLFIELLPDQELRTKLVKDLLSPEKNSITVLVCQLLHRHTSFLYRKKRIVFL